MKSKPLTKNIVLSGLFLALCLLLPFLTGQIPTIGSALSPMHIPVLLCGFVCGWPYGLIVGLIAPPLRFALFGMPPLFPTGVAMMFELATYGLVSGLLYKVFPKKIWGIVTYILTGLSGGEFTFAMFLSGAFVTALPGIICHLILVPLVVCSLQKAKLIAYEQPV